MKMWFCDAGLFQIMKPGLLDDSVSRVFSGRCMPSIDHRKIRTKGGTTPSYLFNPIDNTLKLNTPVATDHI